MNLILHTALSLDGRTSGWPGDRLAEEACLARLGGAVQLIEPDLLAPAARPPLAETHGPKPRLVVFDRSARGQEYQNVLNSGNFSGVCALVGPQALPERVDTLSALGVDLLHTGETLPWPTLLDDLEQRHGAPLVVRSGGRLGAVLLEAGLVGELSLLYNSVLVGSLSPYGLFGPGRWFDPTGPLVWDLTETRSLEGGSLWVRLKRHRP